MGGLKLQPSIMTIYKTEKGNEMNDDVICKEENLKECMCRGMCMRYIYILCSPHTDTYNS